jgi:hypothetical protein
MIPTFFYLRTAMNGAPWFPGYPTTPPQAGFRRSRLQRDRDVLPHRFGWGEPVTLQA